MREPSGSGEDEAVEAWPHPEPLGRRLLWFDGERNVTIPLADPEARPIYTDGRDLSHGWIAALPMENGARLDISWDPEFDRTTSLFLYVEHPEYGYLIDARIGRSPVPDYWIEYGPWCEGPNCEGWCSWCSPIDHQWWEYVSSPQHVLDRLAWIGSLPIRVATHIGRTDGAT